MKDKLKKLRRKKQEPELDPESRVTNDTVALHREQILKGARKYIYPLQHSKHKLVLISVSIFILTVVGFFGFSAVALYKTKTTSNFMYKVTKVIPFPVARIGSDFIPYENYLFEIQHYMHYYQTQQELDFKTDAGQAQLAEFKKRALQKVINDAYIKRIADEKGISVNNDEIVEAIQRVRDQNRISSSDQELEAVLKDYWGWTINDFKRSLKTQILGQKVLSALDTATHNRAEKAYADLQTGKDFAELAKEVSDDDVSKTKGGEYGFLIERSNRDISPKIVDALFNLTPGKYSEVIDTGFGLEIVKNIEQNGQKIKAAHIVFNYKDINQFLNDAKDQHPSRSYLIL